MAHSIIAPEGGELSATAVPPVATTGHAHAGFWALTLGSLGVVYGDIGTSPLYALRAAVVAAIGPNGVVTRDPVLGVLSLILWSLILVVTLK
jgi:KUP system potassium uptake protein